MLKKDQRWHPLFGRAGRFIHVKTFGETTGDSSDPEGGSSVPGSAAWHSLVFLPKDATRLNKHPLFPQKF